jgi:ribonuclease Z
MNAVVKSAAVFTTLSGLFWGGWMVGSQTPAGQEALAKAYEAYAQQQSIANEDLFSTSALRAIVCGGGSSALNAEQKPCLAVIAAGRLFVVDAGSGAAAALEEHNIPMARLQAVLLTSAALPQSADLNEMYADAARNRTDALLPVYGPADTQRMVEGLNAAGGFDGAASGLQAWGPSPEPGRSVIVFEGDGLVVSAFTTQEDAFNGRVGYRFDYRGRSIVVGGDGHVVSAAAAQDANVVLQGAQTRALASLGDGGAPTAAEAALNAREARAGMMVLTSGADDPISGSLQVNEARNAGFSDTIAGKVGMLLELPLANSEVNVRTL